VVDVNEAGNGGANFRGHVAQEKRQRDRVRAARHGHGDPVARAEQASPADRARNGRKHISHGQLSSLLLRTSEAK
jgi:hypothetical protein